MIKSIEVQNFKAIGRSKIKLSPLTAFIGYNGTGKSSILEALETYSIIVTQGLNSGMSLFKGFEHIYYKGKKKNKYFKKNGIKFQYAPIKFCLNFNIAGCNAKISTSIAQELDGKKTVYFLEEKYEGESLEPDYGNEPHKVSGLRTKHDALRLPDSIHYSIKYLWSFSQGSYEPDTSLFNRAIEIAEYFRKWQFLSMNTFLMGNPLPQKQTGGIVTLNKDGSNVAEYILSIREADPEIFQGIVETMQYVLPYAKDIQPTITSELERLVYMQISEQDFKVPGWLLSTGTLKLLALLAIFRNPNPSPLVVIEELENGLDPRSIHLILSEIRRFLAKKDCQVIITSHSPYLLDLLKLDEIILVEKTDSQAEFSRPADNNEMQVWAGKYTPGRLYTMSRLNNK
jgi:predicted ATPase